MSEFDGEDEYLEDESDDNAVDEDADFHVDLNGCDANGLEALFAHLPVSDDKEFKEECRKYDVDLKASVLRLRKKGVNYEH